MRRVPGGLTRKVASVDFTRNQVRALALAGLILRDETSVWVMDNPLEGLRGAAARRCLDVILDRARAHTLVVALSRAVHLDRFDRVLLIKNGRIQFDGTPAEWASFKTTRKKEVKAV